MRQQPPPSNWVLEVLSVDTLTRRRDRQCAQVDVVDPLRAPRATGLDRPAGVDQAGDPRTEVRLGRRCGSRRLERRGLDYVTVEQVVEAG
jgi:hypothetical protein